MANAFPDDSWKAAFQAVKDEFEIAELELFPEQTDVIKTFFSGSNVFVNLPTGFGKSLFCFKVYRSSRMCCLKIHEELAWSLWPLWSLWTLIAIGYSPLYAQCWLPCSTERTAFEKVCVCVCVCLFVRTFYHIWYGIPYTIRYEVGGTNSFKLWTQVFNSTFTQSQRAGTGREKTLFEAGE